MLVSKSKDLISLFSLILSLQIYVVENSLEIYARHLLLLSVALEPKERLGLQGK